MVKKKKNNVHYIFNACAVVQNTETCVLEIRKIVSDLILIRPHKEEKEAHYQVKNDSDLVVCSKVSTKNVHCCNRGVAIFLGEF